MLVNMLDHELQIRDGDDHPFYAQFNTLNNINHLIVAYVDDHAVGCGAFRPYAAQSVEIKRMFVRPGRVVKRVRCYEMPAGDRL